MNYTIFESKKRGNSCKLTDSIVDFFPFLMSASIEQLSNIIYTGELSCLTDYAFEYSSLDLNRSLALVIKRVCAEAEAEDYTDSTVLLDNTIPSLVEFTLLRRCPRSVKIFNLLLYIVCFSLCHVHLCVHSIVERKPHQFMMSWLPQLKWFQS